MGAGYLEGMSMSVMELMALVEDYAAYMVASNGFGCERSEHAKAALLAAFAGMKAEAESAEARIAELSKACDKAKRLSIELADIIAKHCIAMQAAVIEGRLKGPAQGLQWIGNTLFGPGLYPDIEAARALGGAQAFFDKAMAEHDAFRAAHPGPKVAP